jgi:transformer-2 protein
LSIRTREEDLEAEFSRAGRVEKVVIVYDQRVSSFRAHSGCLYSPADTILPYSEQSGRSRGFGFVTLGSVQDAEKAIGELNGIVRCSRSTFSSKEPC